MKKIIFSCLLLSSMAMVNCKSGQVHSSSESTSAQESSEKPLSNDKELPTLQQIDPSIRLNKQR